MTAPRFTAEVSLYKSGVPYRVAAREPGAISTVVPAVFTVDGPFHIGWCCEGFWVLTCYPCYSY